MLCYVMSCYVMLCYVMLCYVMLCYVMLCYVMLCYDMLCHGMWYLRRLEHGVTYLKVFFPYTSCINPFLVIKHNLTRLEINQE